MFHFPESGFSGQHHVSDARRLLRSRLTEGIGNNSSIRLKELLVDGVPHIDSQEGNGSRHVDSARQAVRDIPHPLMHFQIDSTVGNCDGIWIGWHVIRAQQEGCRNTFEAVPVRILKKKVLICVGYVYFVPADRLCSLRQDWAE